LQNNFHNYEKYFTTSSFLYEQDDKPGYVMNDHLSSHFVAKMIERPTRKQAGHFTLSVRSCFGWGLQIPCLLPNKR